MEAMLQVPWGNSMIIKNITLLVGCLAFAACAPKENPRFKLPPPSSVTYKDSFDTIKTAADNGDVYAMQLMWGRFSYSGEEGSVTGQQAVAYLTRAAEMGYTHAQITLAKAYAQKSYRPAPDAKPVQIGVSYGLRQDDAQSLYWMQRMTCDGAGYYSSHYLAALYGGLEDSKITSEERALVEPNLVLAHVHASMTPLKMFGRRVAQEELEKRMTDAQIELAEDIAEEFRRAPECPYLFENDRLAGLRLKTDIMDRYAKTPTL
ncbi:MAG: hypothetical protein DI582_10610 [Azospirillum brasilense]|nr:MAG: hypothetical protein DI582_10610 [Azospirillum brasilense]